MMVASLDSCTGATADYVIGVHSDDGNALHLTQIGDDTHVVDAHSNTAMLSATGTLAPE